VGGLLLSQFLTLFTTPVIYVYLSRLGDWIRPSGDRAVHGQAFTRHAADSDLSQIAENAVDRRA
jgi:HAE1 family hydrophobic/amphiphilic exporter-1